MARKRKEFEEQEYVSNMGRFRLWGRVIRIRGGRKAPDLNFQGEKRTATWFRGKTHVMEGVTDDGQEMQKKLELGRG